MHIHLRLILGFFSGVTLLISPLLQQFGTPAIAKENDPPIFMSGGEGPRSGPLQNNQEVEPGLPWSPPPTLQLSVKLKEIIGPPDLPDFMQRYNAGFVRQNPETRVLTLSAPGSMTPSTLVGMLVSDPRVEWAETVKWRRLFTPPQAPKTPNDASYSIAQKWYYDVIGAPDAWGIETGKSSVVIAILDSGVSCSHPDLQANIWVNPGELVGNGKDDDNNGFVDDVNGYDFVGGETGADPISGNSFLDQPGDSDPCLKVGDPSLGNGVDDDGDGGADGGVFHGTFVSGAAAAVSNNNLGVTGMCWGCRLMVVRVANPEGWIRTNDLADGATYAARNGAKVINVSLGGPDFSQAELAAFNASVNTYGAVVVAAVGNENKNPINYPAQLSNVLAVGASGKANTKGRASFSNWGTGATNDRLLDVVAPGVEIFSTSVNNVADQQRGSGSAGFPVYGLGSGTSFSAPLVSGLVGLILSVNPSLTPAQVRNIVKQTAIPLGDDPGDAPNAGPNWAGSGLINAAAALASAVQQATPTPTSTPPTPTATATVPATGTPSATATVVPLPAGSSPVLLSPASGAQVSGLGATLRWNIATGATQYQIQVIPANNDGPSINLIRNIDTTFDVQEPVFGQGPYVMLPGMTYTWRVRTTNATTGIDESSALWGSWSQQNSFRTRAASSAGIGAVTPLNGDTVTSLMPALRWSNTDANVFYYEVQVSKDQQFGTLGPLASVYWVLLHGGVSQPPMTYRVPDNFPLEPRTAYYWRVRPRIQGDGAPAAWSGLFRFTTP